LGSVVSGSPPAVETPESGLTIVREPPDDVPRIYGDTRAEAMWGAGYVTAEDRLFLMDVLRHYGQGTLSEFLGPSCAFEQMDHDELLVAPYTRAQAQAQLDALPQEYGAEGELTVETIDNFVNGINAFIDKTLTDPSLLPADYVAAAEPPQQWQPSDVVYEAALIGGIFGRGGGGELQNAALLEYLQHQLGQAGGEQAFSDFKEQNDPAAPTTITDKSFPYEIPGTINPATTALPDDPGAPLAGGPTDTTANCDLTQPNPTALSYAIALLGLPRQMSNALVIGAGHSSTGHPLAVFGPQVGYYAPQILMEEDVHAPDYVAEGASFPGTGLVELGRGEDYAWSATSASTDNTDERLELICNPTGGAPSPQGTYYLMDGKCLPMQHNTFSELGLPKLGGLGAPVVLDHDIYWTVHGVVQGWTTADGGKPVAVVEQRSTYNHEVDSAVGFLRWADPAQTYDVQSWMAGTEQINYTFNWFYVDNRDIGYYVSGWDPVRPSDVDPNLPTWGTGVAEWQGMLPADQHPHEIDPAQGFFVSWNNKPAPGFSAADDDYSAGPVQRVQSIEQAIFSQLSAHGGKIQLANLVSAMEEAAVTDLDGRQVLPQLLAFVQSHGGAPSTGVGEMLQQLESWSGAGTLRLKAASTSNQYQDAAAVATMDELEPRLVRALFDPIFAAGGVDTYDGTSSSYSAFSQQPLVATPNSGGAKQGDAYGAGFEGYVQKLLDQLNGVPVEQPFSSAVTSSVCGTQGMSSCQAAIDKALEDTFTALVGVNGGSTDVAAWTADTATATAGVSMPVFDSISSQVIGIVGPPEFDWQNRPTFQQAIEFPRHRPRP
ncbi:MAG TPA: penicillin acylase family protein, partial [Candidatus Acidoferrum sp.]|nr:penicillin acylase family protein [Candidatus Acidoferrum sp.]